MKKNESCYMIVIFIVSLRRFYGMSWFGRGCVVCGVTWYERLCRFMWNFAELCRNRVLRNFRGTTCEN